MLKGIIHIKGEVLVSSASMRISFSKLTSLKFNEFLIDSRGRNVFSKTNVKAILKIIADKDINMQLKPILLKLEITELFIPILAPIVSIKSMSEKFVIKSIAWNIRLETVRNPMNNPQNKQINGSHVIYKSSNKIYFDMIYIE